MRSAIENKRKILVLQDYQFKVPNPLPPGLEDIELFLSKCTKILYMAEFFAECIKKIKTHLGLTDPQLNKVLSVLRWDTKQCILDDRLSGHAFSFIKSVNMSVTDFFGIIREYYGCTTLKDASAYIEVDFPKVTTTDADIETLVREMPNIKTLSLYIEGSGFTDKGVELICSGFKNLQILTFYGNCSYLTDASFVALGKTNLKRLTVFDAPLITDNALKSLSSLTELNWLFILGNKNFSDSGLLYLTQSFIGLTLGSPNFTPEGFVNWLHNQKNISFISFPNADLDDNCIIEIFKTVKQIDIINFQSSHNLTDKCLNTVPVPSSLRQLFIPRNKYLSFPTGCQAQAFWVK